MRKGAGGLLIDTTILYRMIHHRSRSSYQVILLLLKLWIVNGVHPEGGGELRSTGK